MHCTYVCSYVSLLIQLFFVNENGEDTFTAKADIWSAFLTIMHVLLGRDMNDIPLQKVVNYVRLHYFFDFCTYIIINFDVSCIDLCHIINADNRIF